MNIVSLTVARGQAYLADLHNIQVKRGDKLDFIEILKNYCRGIINFCIKEKILPILSMSDSS